MESLTDLFKEYQTLLNELRQYNPELLAIHPMDATGPDEDIMLLEQSFYSFNIQSFAWLPSFDEWIEAHDDHSGEQHHDGEGDDQLD